MKSEKKIRKQLLDVWDKTDVMNVLLKNKKLSADSFSYIYGYRNALEWVLDME